MSENTYRSERISALSTACNQELSKALSGLNSLPDYQVIRKPEIGMYMVRARAGNTGSQFYLGEMLVTRCSVKLENGIIGHAYIIGSNSEHAKNAAILDALWQEDSYAKIFDESLLPKLIADKEQKNNAEAKLVGSTKVDFLTMVRGEDKQ